jgi:TPR repeat protein
MRSSLTTTLSSLLSSIVRPCLLAWALSILVLGVAPAVFADYEAGVNAAFDGDYDTAFEEFTAAAETGLDLAQYNLGILYFTGQGVDQDYAEAFKWTQAAAEQGHLAAQFNLGFLYYEGQGTERDPKVAMQWYEAAGNAGHGEAAFLMARMYQEGDSVDADPVLAHAWASMAISNDHQEAGSLRQKIEDDMEPALLSQARRLFARWQIEM